tara:strand:- start:146 stop:1366 length:1221 start_codon:yes stop_codon:yes gene_type:complete
MNQISRKIDLIERLALSGNFTPIAIKILLDIALSFDELSYENYIEILKGAHVVIRNDSGGYWQKWKYWAEEKLGTCIEKSTKNIVEGVNTEKGCSDRGLSNEWLSYSSDRWSSHPSVSSINLRGKHEGYVYGGILGKSIDQYEINMGHNRYGSTFSMLCGTYEWRNIDNYTRPTKYHNGSMLDPKKFNSLGIESDDFDRDYLVTWFQFEQYAANTHSPNQGIIKKGIDIFSHCLDWASYKWTKKNIGPFGRSHYTENPWKPLYIHCCPDVCYRRSISKGKHNKTKIKDVNYSSGEICQESLDYLKQKFGLDKFSHIHKEKVLDIIMEKYYCYSNAIPCHSDQILYKGKEVESCGSTSVQSILEENFEGGKKKHSKRKTIRKSSRNKCKTKSKKKIKSKHKHTRGKK